MPGMPQCPPQLPASHMAKPSLKETGFRLSQGFPGDSDGKEAACNAGDSGWIPRLGRSPRGGKGYPLQYSCLENSMDREAWRAAIHGVAKNQT